MDEFTRIENRLERIEDKLDLHIERHFEADVDMRSMKGQIKLIWTGIGALMSGALIILVEYIKGVLK